MISLVVEDVKGITWGEPSGLENNIASFTNINNLSDLNAVIEAGSWNLSTVYGLYSTTPLTLNQIMFYNLDYDTEGYYNNTYHIKNPEQLEHGFFVYSQTGFNQLVVQALEDGFAFKDGTSVIDFYDYPNLHALSEYNLTTRWDSLNGRCFVYLESTKIFDVAADKSALDFIWRLLRYNEAFAGIYAYGSGFEVHSLSSAFSLSVDESSFSIGNILKIMATILIWNIPAETLPWIVNILLIKIPLLGLLFIMFLSIRGSG